MAITTDSGKYLNANGDAYDIGGNMYYESSGTMACSINCSLSPNTKYYLFCYPGTTSSHRHCTHNSSANAVYSLSIESIHEHTYSTKVTAPTCTAQGYTTYTCSCGHSYVGDYTSALGHNYADATCVKPKTCTRCGATTGSALGHSYSDATCLQPQICTRCKTTNGSALGHNYINTVVQPTCTEQGYTTHTCSRCNSTYTDTYTTSLGHNWNSGVVTSPTCTQQGHTTYSCTRCSETYNDNYVSELGHAWDNGVITVEPTESTNGTKLYTCTRCSITKSDIIQKLGSQSRFVPVVFIGNDEYIPFVYSSSSWGMYIPCIHDGDVFEQY